MVEAINNLDFSTWPFWAILILVLISFFKDELRGLIGGWRETQEERGEYERVRQSWREDTIFDLLKSTLEWLQESFEKQYVQNEKIIDTVREHGHRLAQNTDILRILSQQSASVNDRLREVEKVVEKLQGLGGDQ